MHGNGVMKFIDGTEYNGEWKENLMNGKGVFKYANRTYDGMF